MTLKKLKKSYIKISRHLLKQNFKLAFDDLLPLIEKSQNSALKLEFEKYNNTYQSMLKYTLDGIEDPNRNKVYQHLTVSIWELSDKVKSTLFSQILNIYFHNEKREDLKKNSFVFANNPDKILEELSINMDLSDTLEELEMFGETQKEDSLRQKIQLQGLLFNKIWLTNRFTHQEVDLLNKILHSKTILWYQKSVFVSALTLSLLRNFDKQKFQLLFDFYFEGANQVKQRALVGLFLCLYLYDYRLHLYPEIQNNIQKLSFENNIEQKTELIILQFIRSKETEKIIKKLEEEIIPEVIKLQPKIEEKLDLDNLLSDDLTEDKNPEWERFFEDTPDIYDKLEELSQMQMEGADIYMSAFSSLKNFNFFRTLSNWFIPFYEDNEELLYQIAQEKENMDLESFLHLMNKSFFMCNSDKYSFCFNIENMPKPQKRMISEILKGQLEQINEMMKDENLLKPETQDKTIYTQYLQDLYRFFKLHPYHKEFSDIFKYKFDFHNKSFFYALVQNDKVKRNLAEFYFEKEHYDTALDILLEFVNTEEENQELFQKIAYCYQKQNDFSTAIDYYKKAELFEANISWNLKKMAFCYRKLHQPENALNTFLEAEKLEPENLYIQASLGHCNLDLERYEEALKYYFKVEYLDSENQRVWRPIAWCSFVLGKFKQAKKYYQKLIENTPTKFDLINLGHVEWCLGNSLKAIKLYKQSIQKDDYNIDAFFISFASDEKYLLHHGIDEKDIPLVLDYLRYELEGEN